MNSPHKRNEPLVGGSERESEKQTSEQYTRRQRGVQDRPFVVTYQKHSGATREYGRYADRGEADRVCSLLKWAGAVAHVIVDAESRRDG